MEALILPELTKLGASQSQVTALAAAYVKLGGTYVRTQEMQFLVLFLLR